MRYYNYRQRRRERNSYWSRVTTGRARAAQLNATHSFLVIACMWTCWLCVRYRKKIAKAILVPRGCGCSSYAWESCPERLLKTNVCIHLYCVKHQILRSLRLYLLHLKKEKLVACACLPLYNHSLPLSVHVMASGRCPRVSLHLTVPKSTLLGWRCSTT